MILPKQEIIKAKAVSDFISDSQFQPAGVDLTLREIYSFLSTGRIDFDNSSRQLPDYGKLEFGPGGWLHVPPGAYKIVYNEAVKIPAGCIALAFPRSSLLRCGATVECAVWDPGYEGRSESLLIVQNPHGISLKKNAKLVQLVFVKMSDAAGETYEGKYHKENL